MRAISSAVSIFLLLSCGNSGSEEAGEARVDRVIDGDTIVVRSGGGEERIRLLGIDAPEMNYGRGRPECGARAATSALRERLDGATIRLERYGRDDYRRTLAIILEGGSEDATVNEWLLREGHAEIFWKSRHPRRKRFIAAARAAESEGKGMWKCGERR